MEIPKIFFFDFSRQFLDSNFGINIKNVTPKGSKPFTCANTVPGTRKLWLLYRHIMLEAKTNRKPADFHQE
jgi:hypothetical protein